MKAQNLPSTYLPIWFFFKLPISNFIWLIILPLLKKKLNLKNHELFNYKFLGLSSIFIIFLLILFEVNLYDEIRQIMFLIHQFLLFL